MQVKWDNAGRTAIRVVFTEPWSWDDLTTASGLVDGLLRMVPHRTAILLDMQDCRSGLPDGYLWHLKGFYQRSLPNAGPLILVSRHSLIASLAGTLDRLPDFKLPDRPIFAATTLKSARALLRNNPTR